MKSNFNKLVQPVASPVEYAMVSICEKCGRRIGGSRKNPSHRLASHLKHKGKRQFGKGGIRVVLTSCMAICPDDRVAVAIQPNVADVPAFYLVVDVEDVEASSEALLAVVRGATNARTY